MTAHSHFAPLCLRINRIVRFERCCGLLLSRDKIAHRGIDRRFDICECCPSVLETVDLAQDRASAEHQGEELPRGVPNGFRFRLDAPGRTLLYVCLKGFGDLGHNLFKVALLLRVYQFVPTRRRVPYR